MAFSLLKVRISAIPAISELITLGNGFFSFLLLGRFHLHPPRHVFISSNPGWWSAWVGAQATAQLSLPPLILLLVGPVGTCFGSTIPSVTQAIK